MEEFFEKFSLIGTITDFLRKNFTYNYLCGMNLSTRFEEAVQSRGALIDEFPAIRLVNGAGDSCPGLTIDRFGHFYQIQCFQPQTPEVISEALKWIRGIDSEVGLIVLKNRVSPDGASLQHPEMSVLYTTEMPKSLPRDLALTQSQIQVTEGSIQVEVDLLDTINPGLFLDMREFRLAQAEWVGQVVQKNSEFKVLNLFSYTCTFGLHAALAGASYTCNVDVSAKILDRGKRNYEISGLAVEQHGFVREDARKFLDFCARKAKTFDSIILDPPTFARFKKKTWSVHKELSGLLTQVNEVLNPGGRLLLSTNASDINNQDLILWAQDLPWHVVAQGGQSKDFPTRGKIRESSLAVVWFEKSILN